MRKRTKVSVVFASLLAIYTTVYVLLSIGGRYEPIAFGLNGVKWYAWAPRGFHAELTWRCAPMVIFAPLHLADTRLWHTSDEALSGKYPITKVDRDDIWKYYEAEGLLDEVDNNGVENHP